MAAREFVGLTTSLPYSLKHEALVFDKIAVPGLISRLENPRRISLASPMPYVENFPVKVDVFADNWRKNFYREITAWEPIVADLQFLIGKHLIVDPYSDASEDELVEMIDRYKFQITKLLKSGETSSISRTREECYLSTVLQSTKKWDVIPIIPPVSVPESSFRLGKCDVIKIVLNEIPIPDPQTPWEDILAFKNDQEVKDTFLALRLWTSKMVREEYTTIEIEEELEHLIQTYEKYMRFQKIKYKKGIREAWIKLFAGGADDILKLRFEKMVDRKFAISHLRLALSEAEINAPAQEVAYIVKTKERFKAGS